MPRVGRRFERWRKAHTARLPIPEALWAEAAKAAREHGVFRASKALHLEYGKLKRIAEAGPALMRPPVADGARSGYPARRGNTYMNDSRVALAPTRLGQKNRLIVEWVQNAAQPTPLN
jgi:hypothetical protein